MATDYSQLDGKRIIYPIDRDNEALIIANAIKSEKNRESFIRKAVYTHFRIDEFKVIAWGIIEAVKAQMVIDIDAILLKSKTCPIRKSITYDFIRDIVDTFPEEPNVNFVEHLDKLILDNVRQELIDWVFSSLFPACIDPSKSLSNIEQRFILGKEILSGAYSSTKLGFKTLQEIAEEYDRLKATSVTKRTTGFSQLDMFLTEGFKDGQITTVAGLSSMGKSSFALSIMRNLSYANVPTAQFALEMNNMSLFTKFLAFRTKLPIRKIIMRPEDLTDDERKIYELEKKVLSENRFIYLNDNPSQSIASIREQIMLLQDKIKQQYIVVVIDLFGKIRELQSSDNFARDYEKKLNELQVLVRELGVHMILVAQINRAVEKRKDKRPTMNDLKNAGALAEVSDIILGIHRPYYDPSLNLKKQLMYGINAGDDEYPLDDFDDYGIDEDINRNIAEVIILKQRMGPKDILVNFVFDPVTTGFYPVTEGYQKQLNLIKLEEDEE